VKLARYVKFREEKFGGVLFETRTEKVFTLNPAAVSIVRRIQAGDSEEQIVASLKGSFRDSRDALEREALQFIADLRERGLVETP
jgi:putative mycofactocin binding protein MftB